MEIYFSADIETDGPIPGPNSMLSLGCAAYDPSGDLLGTFYRNILPLEGATENPGTMAWWKTQPKAWEALQENRISPEQCMSDFKLWIREIQELFIEKSRPVMMAFPAGFDFLFIYWYFIKFLNWSPFSFSCIDIKTYAMATLKCDYKLCTKRKFPKHWSSNTKHNHTALQDAIEQAELFFNIRKDNKDLK